MPENFRRASNYQVATQLSEFVFQDFNLGSGHRTESYWSGLIGGSLEVKGHLFDDHTPRLPTIQS